MAFAQLKYSEKQAEKKALFSLLNEYFESRTSPHALRTGFVKDANEKSLASEEVSKQSARAPLVKPKPTILASRTVYSAPKKPPQSPFLRGPPPINRDTRPKVSAVPEFPQPLVTPSQWAGSIPNFQYPPVDHPSPGIALFNRCLPNAINELHSATLSIFQILYSDPEEFKAKCVQSPVSLIMRDMEGVAHAANSMSYVGNFSGQSFPNVTHCSDLVFSTKYLTSLENHSDPTFEIRGIILHELTHTFQLSAEKTPGGLTEGIADFVRLRGGYAAKHWKESPAGKSWDQGYETTAYFLDWVEKHVYEGLVMHVNDWLGKNKTYDEGAMFSSVMPGWSWEILWDQYLARR